MAAQAEAAAAASKAKPAARSPGDVFSGRVKACGAPGAQAWAMGIRWGVLDGMEGRGASGDMAPG